MKFINGSDFLRKSHTLFYVFKVFFFFTNHDEKLISEFFFSNYFTLFTYFNEIL